MIDRTKLKNFHTYVGEVIMYCQCIEHDIKMIYAGMKRGDFDDNLFMVKKDSLGEVVNNLERLDMSDDNPFFAKADYKYMKKIARIRNYWAHDGYVGFVYEDTDEYFNNISKRLVEDREQLERFSSQVENIRIDVLKTFGRLR